ncbi:MAG: GGDEF domain-containing protein [Chlorobiaceae bacterium]|nr:GGDEF domain-containing protein [Chlorobiaceae bacterium]
MSAQELARQTLIQLTKSKTPPTPENYQRVYNEIAGKSDKASSFSLIHSFEKVLDSLSKENPHLQIISKALSENIRNNDASGFENNLIKTLGAVQHETIETNLPQLLKFLLKQIDLNQNNSKATSRREELSNFLGQSFHDQNNFIIKFQTLLSSWGEVSAFEANSNDNESFNTNPLVTIEDAQKDSLSNSPTSNNDALVDQWRDMLIRTINVVAIPQTNASPAAIERVEKLIKQAYEAKTEEEINALRESLKRLLLRAEMQSDTHQRVHQSLLKVIQLLVVNIREFTTPDDWLSKQVAIIEEIISKPLDLESVSNAEFVLNELLSKHSNIKPSLLEAKTTLKNMMTAFVKGLEEITQSTGVYESKINHYQGLIAETEDIARLDEILQSLASDISIMSKKASESHKAFTDTQAKVNEAEQKINELTIKLEFISQAAYQDFLTGTLNRRGLDEAIEREFNRADKHNTAISIALIDIDHFKKINDKLGHRAGDTALAHLAKVVKDVLRNTDVLARFGGEEFLILLPGSQQDDAVTVISGVQRSLTKNFFLHEKEKVLITFSAGVAERMLQEQFDTVLTRADAALYIAKKTGRNKVVGAE